MSRLQRAEWDSGVDSPPQERLGSSLSWGEQTPRPDDRMFTQDLDRCCALPKALLSGRSRDQNGLRSALELVETGSERDRVNPLIYWGRDALEAYAEARELPLSPLYREGFLSIGCAPCPRAVRVGEHARAGRWSGRDRTECGLWLEKMI